MATIDLRRSSDGMGGFRRKQRWPTTAIVIALLVVCLFLNLLLYGAKMPDKVSGFVRHPRALRHVEGGSVATTEHQLPLPLGTQIEFTARNGSILVPGCRDTHSSCSKYKQGESCLHDPGFALSRCQATCGVCERLTLSEVPEEVQISSNVSMPLVGFGTAGLGNKTQQAVQIALASGYRLIDSAQAPEWYREAAVGSALRNSSVDRRDVFLTSKLHPRHHGYESALQQLSKSLENLGTTYLDLMLLHYPECWGTLCEGTPPQGTWRDSWRAFEHAVDQGRLRAIGVSNFDMAQLNELRAFARIQPAVVQRNSDPFSQDAEMRSYCRLAGIQYQAFSSLGSQWLMRGHRFNPVLWDAVIEMIAEELDRSTAQVILKWALQSGMAVIPQSSRQLHIQSNLELDDFTLTPEQLLKIDARDGALS